MITNFTKNNQPCFQLMSDNNYEKEYLTQAINLVERKIDDDSFKLNQFATEMANSRSTLYRKMKSLTGLTPIEFIRTIRLNHAVHILLNNNCDISEIAYRVGFNDPKYFSRCFKREFGLSPQKYKMTMINMN
jgi:AraC-like DNA-binding protein